MQPAFSASGEGRVRRGKALVTGAARGIGRAIAEGLAEDGWRVIAADRNASVLAASGAQWATEGRDILVEQLDVSDRSAVVALMERHGEFQVAVNNAGISGVIKPIGQMTSEAFEAVLRVNVLGVFIVAQEAAKRMQPGGAIINIASRSYLSSSGSPHYGMSKGGVVGLTRAMAMEYRWRGISVNAVSPGLIDTEILRTLSNEHVARMAALEPSGGAMDPTVIAGAVRFLASPAGQWMRGQNLLVDDGKSMGIDQW
jgi:3-oxoacyl-[acyl-carrier protein] reductase